MALLARSSWLPSPGGPLSCRITTGETPGDLGCVLLPAFAEELSTSYPVMRVLAEELARHGVSTARVDYLGTGDSAGDATDITLSSLRTALPAAAAALRELGVTRLAVAGLRLGGLLALLDASSVGAHTVLAWAPVAPGNRYPRELRLLGEPAPPEARLGDGGVLVAGHGVSAALLAELAGLTVGDAGVEGCTVLLVDRNDRPASRSWQPVLSSGAPGSTVLSLPGVADFLDVPAEDAVVPRATVAALAEALLASTGPGRPVAPTDAPVGPDLVPVDGPGGACHEAHVVVGARGLTGVRTTTEPTTAEPTTAEPTPQPVATRDTALVLWNSGSDPHHGPGRAWVDLARRLAGDDLDVFRIDFSGWGDSPADERATRRPYDLHVVEDVVDAVSALRKLGYRRVVSSGLCASAWLVLHAARHATERGAAGDGVIGLNPQLYWHPGDPIEALLTETRLRRADEIAAIRAAHEAGVWTEQDLAGVVPDEGQWLQALSDARLPVDLLFAEGDDGLVHLRDRLANRLAGVQRAGWLHVEELPGVDHAMTRSWLRGTVAQAVRRALARQAALPPTVGASDEVNRATWEEVTTEFDAEGWSDPGEPAALTFVADRVRGQPLLDVGVGAGRTVSLLRLISDSYIGVDYTPGMVARARQRHPGVDIRAGDARALTGFADASQALVCFSVNGLDAVGHEDRQLVLAEFARVLRPGGYAVVSTLNLDGGLHGRNPGNAPSMPWHVGSLLPGADEVALPEDEDRLRRAVTNWRRLRRPAQTGDGWDVSVMPAHSFSLLTHFTTLAAARREFADHGLRVVAVFPADRSEPLADGEATDAPYFHLVAVRD